VNAALPGIRGLFQQRVSGDDALLRLTRLRFSQTGMPAELYADTPDELDELLGYVPDHQTPPTVHLNRRVDLLQEHGRALVSDFAARFAGRVSGLVVHDQVSMLHRTPELVAALRQVGDRSDGPFVFLEYAARLPLDWFADVAHAVAGVQRSSVCVDIGHVGLAEVRRRLAEQDGRAAAVRLGDPDLADQADRVQQATGLGLPAVLALVAQLGALGKTLHLHLHDGHPAVPGLSDHFSFLTRFPVPFGYQGARSLPPLFGPAGLAAILHQALDSCGPQRLSLTLEIHQAEGRLPLDAEAVALFGHWADLTNAERLNYWLSVIADNQVLASSLLRARQRPPG